MKNKLNGIAIIGIILAVIVIIASSVYLFTGEMIPGLIPLCSAALMVPLWQQQKQNKTVSVLLLTAAVLNVVAGIIQICTAIFR